MTVTLSLKAKGNQALNSIIHRIAESKRCVVVAGAGVSVSAGIPDFRSSSGLFAEVQKKHGNLFLSGKDLFDASQVFRTKEAVDAFNSFITALSDKCRNTEPAEFHHWLANMARRGSLQRCYTQNIDGLEEKAGLSVLETSRYGSDNKQHTDKCEVVPLHGDMRFLVCAICKQIYSFIHNTNSAIGDSNTLNAGDPCPECLHRSNKRVEVGRRALPVGCLRPNIVLYNEPHPHEELVSKVIAKDTAPPLSLSAASKTPDVILIVGTSLKVHGCQKLVRALAANAHRANEIYEKSRAQRTSKRGGEPRPPSIVVLLNRDPVCTKAWEGIIDYQIVGDIETLCKKSKAIWNSQSTLDRWMPAVKKPHGSLALEFKNQNKRKAMAAKPSSNAQRPDVHTASKSPKQPSSPLAANIFQTPPGSRQSKRLKIQREHLRSVPLPVF
ncbi:NAD-dependent deacetylase hst3 [Mycoemilia scoparia]|uniref:NAD-dependent deacetylase hst3 n=1 Tax=Mycoemilia scoparia TaxID=417184 RepID=A0A9W8A2N7_9FUNG|nr:NAD-dependent deacetylase hst3 [Mycoemilia scoparia]